MPRMDWDQTHLYVLYNSTDEVEQYVEEHKKLRRSLNPSKNENKISKEHNISFIYWLRDHILLKMDTNHGSIPDILRWLSPV